MDAYNPVVGTETAGSLELTGLVKMWSFHCSERSCLNGNEVDRNRPTCSSGLCMWSTQAYNPTYTHACNTHTNSNTEIHVHTHSQSTLALPSWWLTLTSSRSLCLSSRSVSSFCCKLRAFISSMVCFFSRSLSWAFGKIGHDATFRNVKGLKTFWDVPRPSQVKDNQGLKVTSFHLKKRKNDKREDKNPLWGSSVSLYQVSRAWLLSSTVMPCPNSIKWSYSEGLKMYCSCWDEKMAKHSQVPFIGARKAERVVITRRISYLEAHLRRKTALLGKRLMREKGASKTGKIKWYWGI